MKGFSFSRSIADQVRSNLLVGWIQPDYASSPPPISLFNAKMQAYIADNNDAWQPCIPRSCCTKRPAEPFAYIIDAVKTAGRRRKRERTAQKRNMNGRSSSTAEWFAIHKTEKNAAAVPAENGKENISIISRAGLRALPIQPGPLLALAF